MVGITDELLTKLVSGVRQEAVDWTCSASAMPGCARTAPSSPTRRSLNHHGRGCWGVYNGMRHAHPPSSKRAAAFWLVNTCSTKARIPDRGASSAARRWPRPAVMGMTRAPRHRPRDTGIRVNAVNLTAMLSGDDRAARTAQGVWWTLSSMKHYAARKITSDGLFAPCFRTFNINRRVHCRRWRCHDVSFNLWRQPTQSNGTFCVDEEGDAPKGGLAHADWRLSEANSWRRGVSWLRFR